MNSQYGGEYNELKSRQQALVEQINRTEAVEYNAKTFSNLIEKYINITELNARIRNELIEKILVHEKETIEGGKVSDR